MPLILTATFALLLSGSIPPASGTQQCIEITRDVQLTMVGWLGEGMFYSPAVFTPPKVRTTILKLEAPICLDDGEDGLADPSRRFVDVHVAADKPLDGELRALLGRRVEVTGPAWPASTGHHHAPLVLRVERFRLQ